MQELIVLKTSARVGTGAEAVALEVIFEEMVLHVCAGLGKGVGTVAVDVVFVDVEVLGGIGGFLAIDREEGCFTGREGPRYL